MGNHRLAPIIQIILKLLVHTLSLMYMDMYHVETKEKLWFKHISNIVVGEEGGERRKCDK